MTIELPESVTRKLDDHRISPDQVRTFVVQAVETWLQVQEERQSSAATQPASRFSESAAPFAEKLIRENRELFERLAKV